MKNYFLVLFMFLLSESLTSQSASEISLRTLDQADLNPSESTELTCHTMRIPLNQKDAEDYLTNQSTRNQSTRSSNTWNVNQGYGSSCEHDCIMTTPVSCSNSGQSIYRIPVVFTVSTQAGCGISTPSQTNIDNQLDLINDFYACQGIPLFFYKSITYSSHPTTGDLSTRYQNIGCTYSAGSVTDVPNVLNFYIFANTQYGTGCNGWAFLPSGTSAPNKLVIARSCLNSLSYTQGTLSCASPSLGNSIVPIHEIGHVFGLHHTHGSYVPGPNANYPSSSSNNYFGTISQEKVDGTNSCTTGDFIADTNADLGISHAISTQGTPSGTPPAVPNPVGGCATNAGCDITFSCTDVNSQVYSPIENNIMNYNNYVNCRTEYTTCQKAKIIDALLCARGPQMCDRNVNLELVDGINGATKTICLGDPAPTFIANNNCYNWYYGLGDATTLLSANTTTFTPSIGTGLGQLNNNVIGTYTWYLGDINEFNPNCRTPLTINVLAETGLATANGTSAFVSTSCNANQNAVLTTDATTLGLNNVIGWWVTEGIPIENSVINQTTLTTALNNVQQEVPLSNPVNHLFKSTSGSPLKNLNLPFDCGVLDKEKNYFVTPLVGNYLAAVPSQTFNCSNLSALCGSSSPVNFGCGILSGGTYSTGSLNALPNNPTPTFTVQLNNINYPASCTSGQMLIDVRNATTGAYIGLFLPGNSNPITFTQVNFPNFNIKDGIRIYMYDQATATCCNGVVAIVGFDVNITVNYPAIPGIPFPSANYSDCLFGNSVALNCSCDCIPQASIVSSDIDNSICPSEAVTLTSQPQTNVNYIWNDGSTTSSLIVTPNVTTQYTVTVTHQVVNCNSTSSVNLQVEGMEVHSQQNDGFGSLRNIIDCLPTSGGTITFNGGLVDTSFLTSPLLLNKNIEIQGNNNGTIHLDFNELNLQSATYGLSVEQGKIVTFQNLKLYQLDNDINHPIIINNGNLILNNVISSGNVDPVFINSNTGQVQAQNSVLLKKD